MKIIDIKYHNWNSHSDEFHNDYVLFEIDKKYVLIGEPIVHNNKNYSIRIINSKSDIAFVQEFEFNEEFEETFNYDDFECPYCGVKETDSWEYEKDEEFDIICNTCGKTYEAYAEISVTYKTSPKGTP